MPLNLMNTTPHLKRNFLSITFLLFAFYVMAQDSSQTLALDSVTVHAFGGNSRLRNLPAAIGYISNTTLRRFGTASVVEAVNTTPGVRMEERSPGSYRFNIRGSSLRS